MAEAWAATERGARQAIFVGGEPGAGKSRLVAEACTALHNGGAAVLSGGCIADFGPPYQPFERPVHSLLDAILDGTLSTSLADPGAVAERLRTITGRLPPSAGAPGMDVRLATYDALVQVLGAATRQRPVVLALEDLHWAGTSALQLLSYVTEQTAEMPLLLLVTHRTTAPDRSEELQASLAPLSRLEGVRRLALGPLDTAEVAEFLVREGGVPQRQVEAVAVALREQTGGNPFLLREVCADLLGSGGVSLATIRREAAPEIARDAVLQRLRGLAAPSQQVLQLAAVLGEEVTADAVVAVFGSDAALPALDEITATGLLERVPGWEGTYRFVHALTRQAVIGSLPSSALARHHERIALALEDSGASVEQLAHHYSAAAVLGHNEKAVRYLIEAARLAEGGLAHAEATRLYGRAAALCTDAYERDALMLLSARCALLACDFARARELYLTVATQGDPRHRLRAAVEYEVTAWHTGRPGQRALDVLTTAMRDGPQAPDNPDQIRAMAGLGRAISHTGDHERGESMVANALELARRSGSDDLLCDTLGAALHVGTSPSLRHTRLHRASELSVLAARTGKWEYLGPIAYHRSVIAYQEGDLEGLASARRSLEEVAAAAGHHYWAYLAGCVDFGTRLIAADFTAAESSCAVLLRMGRTFGDDNTEGPYGVQSFMLRRETGAVERVRHLITGHELAADHWPPALLALYTELGMAAAARRVLEQSLGDDLEAERRSARWPATLGYFAEAALLLEDAEIAARLRPFFDEFAGLNLIMGPFVAVFGAADRFIAALDSLMGRGSPEDAFGAALELDKRTHAPLHQAQTLAAWAVHARRVGDADLARTMERDARQLATASGMVRVLATLDRQGRHRGARPEQLDGLTERETEVLRLLGEGLSNRDLAQRLTISENTAANHVRSIMMKTGCSNRTQAAMYASSKGLLAD
ncbi:MAG: hypothetical protein QOJ11_389 [Frankiales bacterium]|nr:hypothetical protein [Frankiales bacterium]